MTPQACGEELAALRERLAALRAMCERAAQLLHGSPLRGLADELVGLCVRRLGDVAAELAALTHVGREGGRCAGCRR